MPLNEIIGEFWLTALPLLNKQGPKVLLNAWDGTFTLSGHMQLALHAWPTRMLLTRAWKSSLHSWVVGSSIIGDERVC